MAARRLNVTINNRGLLLAALVFVCVLAVAIFSLNRGGGRIVPAEGGTYVESSIGPVGGVNPLLASTPAERDLAALVFAGLTRLGPAGEPLPDMAEEWEASPDARVFTFRLRRDMSWHDGEPVRIEDVIFTINLVKSGVAADAGLVEVWRNATITRTGDRTVQVELPAPFAPLPAYAGFGLLPEHLLRDVSAQAMASIPFNTRPVGTGPFRLLDLTDSAARLARYDRYHLGPAYLDQIELRFDGSTDGADAGVLAGNASGAGRDTFLLAREAYVAVMLNNDAPLFATDTVRRALSLAVDRRGLVTNTLGGRGALTDVPFAPGSWGFDGVEPAPQNLELARALLASSGWAPGPDGVLRRGNRELRFTLLIVDEPAWLALARSLAETWSAIGARVTIAPAGEQALQREFLNPRAYEAALIGWDPGPDPDPFSAWHSSLRGVAGGNPANFADERSDALLLEGRVLTNEAARAARYAEFQARFRELTPSIVLFAEVVRYGVRGGIQLSLPATVSDPSGRFTDVRRWHIQTRRGPDG